MLTRNLIIIICLGHSVIISAQIIFPKDSVAPDGTVHERLISKLGHEDSLVLNHVAAQFQIKQSVGLANNIIRENIFPYKQIVLQPDGYKLRAYDFHDEKGSPFVVKISNSKDSLLGLFSFTDEAYIIRQEIFPTKYKRKYKWIEEEVKKNWVNGRPPAPTFKRNFEENLNKMVDILGYKNDYTKTRVLINALLVDLLGMSEMNWQEYFRSLDMLKKETKKFNATKAQIAKYIGEYGAITQKLGECHSCTAYKTKNGGMFGYWIIELNSSDSADVKIKFVSELFFRPNIRL